MSLLTRATTRLITSSSRARPQIVPTTLCAARAQQHQQQQRPLSSTASLKAGDSHAHEDHYDAPSGWLFNVKPGEKYENEGWETVWYYGFVGSLLFGLIGYCYKPDTRYAVRFREYGMTLTQCNSIQTWALEEARRRLEAEGILEDPEK